MIRGRESLGAISEDMKGFQGMGKVGGKGTDFIVCSSVLHPDSISQLS